MEDALDVTELEEKIENLEEECRELRQSEKVLEKIVDRLAEIGLIESNPHTKMLYREGRREI